MGLRRVCVLSAERGTVDPATLNCWNKSHRHTSLANAEISVKAGEVEWIKEPTNRSDKGVVRILKKKPRLRGLSATVGETLALAIQNQEPWAGVMLAEIRN